VGAWRPNVGVLRTFNEQLFEDTCTIMDGSTVLTWPRTNSAIIPCRAGEEHTLAQPYDPQDANTRTSSEWIVTMPFDVFPSVGDRIITTIVRQGQTIEGVIGETNDPQTWLLATRVYMTRQVTAVAADMIIFKRDTDFDGIFEIETGPFATKVIFDRVEPLETPIRYTPSARSSYRPVRLIFEDQFVDVMAGDIFVYQGYFGEVVSVTPGQQFRMEANGWVDFSGIR
jgi:hypothetical protein